MGFKDSYRIPHTADDCGAPERSRLTRLTRQATVTARKAVQNFELSLEDSDGTQSVPSNGSTSQPTTMLIAALCFISSAVFLELAV